MGELRGMTSVCERSAVCVRVRVSVIESLG